MKAEQQRRREEAQRGEEEQEAPGRKPRRGRGVEQPTNCSRLPTPRAQEERRGDAPERGTGWTDGQTGGRTDGGRFGEGCGSSSAMQERVEEASPLGGPALPLLVAEAHPFILSSLHSLALPSGASAAPPAGCSEERLSRWDTISLLVVRRHCSAALYLFVPVSLSKRGRRPGTRSPGDWFAFQ